MYFSHPPAMMNPDKASFAADIYEPCLNGRYFSPRLVTAQTVKVKQWPH